MASVIEEGMHHEGELNPHGSCDLLLNTEKQDKSIWLWVMYALVSEHHSSGASVLVETFVSHQLKKSHFTLLKKEKKKYLSITCNNLSYYLKILHIQFTLVKGGRYLTQSIAIVIQIQYHCYNKWKWIEQQW